MTAERISAGACREKRGSRAGRNWTAGGGARTGEHSLPVNRSRQRTTGRGTQTGSGRIWQTGHTLPEGAREKNISRQPGEPERTAPAHHRQTRHLSPLCLKGHGITGGSVNGKGEGNRRREKPGETPYHRRNGTGEDRPEGVQGTTWLL